MKAYRKLLGAGLLSTALLLPHHSLAQMNFNFSTSTPRGGCIIGFKGGNAPDTTKPMKLEFVYRIKDGNLGANIKVNGWPKAQQEDPNRVVPVTLVLDNGRKTVSADGGYSSGFNDRLWASWGAEKSAEAFAMMKNAKSVHVTADGMDLGDFDLQVKGLVHSWISDCVEKQRSGGS